MNFSNTFKNVRKKGKILDIIIKEISLGGKADIE